MTAHAEDALRGAGISQVLDLPLAVAAAETGGAERLVTSEDSQILDLVAAGAAAVCTVVADERAIAEEKEVRIRVEEGSAGITSETVQMPSIASCRRVLAMPSSSSGGDECCPVRWHQQHTKFEGLSLLENLDRQSVS